jgi:3-deoxy-D-manno-octulosonic-acid transferase
LHPSLFLIVVPRHFERSREVGRELEARGVRFVYRSEITGSQQFDPGTIDSLVVNTTGELRLFYEHADIVFVGKSLVAHGGQNPIEPGSLAKPMVFGPNMENFAAITSAFLREEGAMQVRDATELESVLDILLSDPARRQRMGRNALRVVRENQGGIERTVDMILRHLEGGDLYIAPRL